MCKLADCNKPESLKTCSKTCSGSSGRAIDDTGKIKLVKMMVTLYVCNFLEIIFKRDSVSLINFLL